MVCAREVEAPLVLLLFTPMLHESFFSSRLMFICLWACRTGFYRGIWNLVPHCLAPPIFLQFRNCFRCAHLPKPPWLFNVIQERRNGNSLWFYFEFLWLSVILRIVSRISCSFIFLLYDCPIVLVWLVESNFYQIETCHFSFSWWLL